MARSPEEILRQYGERGLRAPVGFGRRPAVLVIDFIIGFTEESSPLAGDFEAELGATSELLEAARRKPIPVFFTTTAYAADFSDGGLFVVKVPALRRLERGSRWVELDPRLGRRSGEQVIEKQYASAFFGTSLAQTLTALRVDTLLIAGCTTSGCVRATVVDAIQHGFRAIVPRQCVGDRAPEPHTANLIDIDAKYGDVVELDEVLRVLEALPDT